MSHYGTVVDSVDKWDVIECEPCGFKHIVPIPTEQELDTFYREEFFEQKDDYCQRQLEDIAWWNAVFQERYQLFEKLVEGRRILDIGCGPGFFLQHGKENGWDTVGVEPATKASAYARSLGLDVMTMPVDWDLMELGKFDVVYMNGVMEHLRNPLAVVGLCKRLLSPGGVLFTCVANDYNPFQQIVRGETGPWWLVPPEHINYFSVDSITRLVKRCGFFQVSATTTFPIDMFLLFGDNYIKTDLIGRQCHQRRKNFESRLDGELKQRIYKAFSNLNLGREVEVIGRHYYE